MLIRATITPEQYKQLRKEALEEEITIPEKVGQVLTNYLKLKNQKEKKNG
jgi:hypothetical protein